MSKRAAPTGTALEQRIDLLPAHREADLALETLEERVKRLGTELLARIVGFVAKADVAVVDLPSLEQAVALRQSIGALDKEAETAFAPEKAKYHALHKAACERESIVRAPLTALDNKVRAAIREFNDAQERERQAKERELAEQARIDQQNRAAAEAAAHEREGQHEMAAAVLEEAIAAPMPVVVVPSVTSQVAGLKFRPVHKWRYSGGPNEVKDTPPAILERAMRLVPREYLAVDEAKVGAYGRAMKESARIPGIEFYVVKEPIR